jgi:hypothetical protein
VFGRYWSLLGEVSRFKLALDPVRFFPGDVSGLDDVDQTAFSLDLVFSHTWKDRFTTFAGFGPSYVELDYDTGLESYDYDHIAVNTMAGFRWDLTRRFFLEAQWRYMGTGDPGYSFSEVFAGLGIHLGPAEEEAPPPPPPPPPAPTRRRHLLHRHCRQSLRPAATAAASSGRR